MKPQAAEQHFPWYIDSSDTDNIDCQCGHPCDGIAGWATHITTEGLTMNDDPLTIQVAAAINFAISASQTFTKTWTDGHLASDIGPQLRCEEAEALADMLNFLGHHDAAQTWLEAHATSDTDCEDSHHKNCPNCTTTQGGNHD